MKETGYRLLDCGHGRRLEELGGVVVSRPAPAADFAPGLGDVVWRRAGLAFDRGRGWEGGAPEEWSVASGGVRLLLRPAAQGQIGMFPEHAAVADRVVELIAALFPAGPLAALNLFAHTGLLSLRLAAARSGISVAHVDAARSAVRQAGENAALSGLEDAGIRWLVDDALEFMQREIRRGRNYNVIAADPPSFGRAGKGRREWKLERDLPEFLETAARLFPPGAGLFCLTCHSGGWTAGRLSAIVRDAFPGWTVESGALELRSAAGGKNLPAGIAAYAWKKDGPG